MDSGENIDHSGYVPPRRLTLRERLEATQFFTLDHRILPIEFSLEPDDRVILYLTGPGKAYSCAKPNQRERVEGIVIDPLQRAINITKTTTLRVQNPEARNGYQQLTIPKHVRIDIVGACDDALGEELEVPVVGRGEIHQGRTLAFRWGLEDYISSRHIQQMRLRRFNESRLLFPGGLTTWVEPLELNAGAPQPDVDTNFGNNDEDE